MSCFLIVSSDSDLMHHGVKGQKWGVRRYQNKDGSLTALGKARQHGGKEMTEEEVQKALRSRFDEADMEIRYDPRKISLTESLIKKYGDKPYKDIENPKRIEEAKKDIEKYTKLRNKLANERGDLYDEYLDKRYSEEGISSEEERDIREKAKKMGDKINEYNRKVGDSITKRDFFNGWDKTRTRVANLPYHTPSPVLWSMVGEDMLKGKARELWYSKLKRGK